MNAPRRDSKLEDFNWVQAYAGIHNIELTSRISSVNNSQIYTVINLSAQINQRVFTDNFVKQKVPVYWIISEITQKL